jgi:AraC-like DNA-binding protein
MKKVLGKDTYSIRTLQLLQTALFNDLHHIQNIEIQDKTSDLKSTHAEDVFNRFIDLVNEFGSQHRRIDFYADKLFLSPNRLSTVIKNYSGQTVMDWINRQTILQAKILLKHSDLMVYEIANRLHLQESTAFVRFFKNQTGMTPKEYQGN